MRNEYVNHIYNMFQPYIPEDERSLFKSALEYAPDDRFEKLLLVKVYDPTAVVLISVFGGGFGADRFYIGDILFGVGKLLLSGVTFGIWPLIDIFFSYRKAKVKNLEKLFAIIK